MTTAQEIMTSDTRCVGENQNLVEAARMLRDLNVGALPICGEDNRLKGMVTDRDIVIKCIAEGGDPQQTTAGALAAGKPVTVGADDDIEVALHTMAQHKVRRLPVIDGHDPVGIISQADIARHLPEEKIGDLLEAVSY
jgi:CBS domain-containing protein